MDLTRYFGVPWSIKKMRPLASLQRYIGFDWNLVSHMLALPQEKLSKTLSILDKWLSASETFSARDAASLHGKLIHISCIFPLIRPFLCSISTFASSFTSLRSGRPVPPAMLADLSWIQFLIRNLPNEIPLAPSLPIDLHWWGDTSTSFGIGIALGHYWAVWRWAPGFRVGPLLDYDIGWAEAVAVELGLRLGLDLGLLGSADQRGHSFLVRSDNTGIVSVTNKDLLQVQHQIRLKSVYVASRDNIADALPRGAIKEFLSGFPEVNCQASIPLPSHLADKLVSL